MASLIHGGIPKYNYKNSQVIISADSGEGFTSTIDAVVWHCPCSRTQDGGYHQNNGPWTEPQGLVPADNLSTIVTGVY
jgi:hypothetical protein